MHLEGGPSGSRSFNEIEFLDITGSTDSCRERRAFYRQCPRGRNPEDRRGATPRALPIEFVELNPLQGFGKAIALWELNGLFVSKLYGIRQDSRHARRG